MQLLTLITIAFGTLIHSSPIIEDLSQKGQDVLGYKFSDHPILDKYVRTGFFNAHDVDEEISETWKLLEETVDKKVILNELESVDSLYNSKVKTQCPVKHPKLLDLSTYEYVQSDDIGDYKLRIKNNKFSDPVDLGVDVVKQFSGYFDINEDDKHLFFWFFESRNDPANDPVILWLNGGPGCSSMTGLFFELGPSSINSTTLKPIYNPYSWNNNASVIFLDQPVGVGYSYAEKSTVSTTDQAAEDVYAFLQLFFMKFAHLQKNDFHIAGESYGGHYIPKIASVIANHAERVFNFASVLIGNGFTDTLIQYYYYIPMACNATESGYEKLVDDKSCAKMEGIYPKCASLIKNCYRFQNALTCLPANLYCEQMMGPFEKTELNYYDIREKCIGEGCYPQMSFIDAYMNTPEVKEALGGEVENYTGCDDKVFRRFTFSGDETKPFQGYVAELLNLEIPVLIYAGDKDYICNWLGNRGWLEELEWADRKSYIDAPVKKWISSIDGQHAGTVKSNGLLTFLRVYEAGHMVPFNQPSNSLDMVNRWLSRDYSFSSS